MDKDKVTDMMQTDMLQAEAITKPETDTEIHTAPVVCAGIDVGAEELVLVIRRNGTAHKAQTFANTPAERARLVKKLRAYPDLRVCLEATGVYYLDLALALADANVPLMVVNPKASHHFAKARLQSSKTDALDASMLAEYAARMDFVAWVRPAPSSLALRSLARRIDALTREKAAAKNQLHAVNFSGAAAQGVVDDVLLGIRQLEVRIAALAESAQALIEAQPALARMFALLVGIKGIGPVSAVALMGELLLLPPGLTHKQWVKFAGLDPRAFDSGKSVHKPPRLSKAGNARIRRALYMPALSAKQHDPYVKAYFQHLIDQGKKPLQAVCAVMRKLLHAIHGMLTHDQPFDNTRFYAIPA